MESLVNYSLKINEISLKNNNLIDGSFSASINLSRDIVKRTDAEYEVTFVLEIMNSAEHPFPVDIRISISGCFDVSNLKENDVTDFVEIQSCQILFPQIRAILGSLTTSAMIPPILLPIVDARQLFKPNH